MNITYVILCPDRNIQSLKITVNSIRNNCCNNNIVAVAAESVTTKELKEFKEICDCVKAGNTITSLINAGFKKVKQDWVFLIFAGSRVTKYLERKLELFAKSEKDVLYPILNHYLGFIEGSFNGVLIHKSFFVQAGDFPTITAQKQQFNDFEFAKFMWSLSAIEQGVVFKGIVGMKIV
jgi:hypothetical protein